MLGDDPCSKHSHLETTVMSNVDIDYVLSYDHGLSQPLAPVSEALQNAVDIER